MRRIEKKWLLKSVEWLQESAGGARENAGREATRESERRASEEVPTEEVQHRREMKLTTSEVPTERHAGMGHGMRGRTETDQHTEDAGTE